MPVLSRPNTAAALATVTLAGARNPVVMLKEKSRVLPGAALSIVMQPCSVCNNRRCGRSMFCGGRMLTGWSSLATVLLHIGRLHSLVAGLRSLISLPGLDRFHRLDSFGAGFIEEQLQILNLGLLGRQSFLVEIDFDLELLNLGLLILSLLRELLNPLTVAATGNQHTRTGGNPTHKYTKPSLTHNPSLLFKI